MKHYNLPGHADHTIHSACQHPQRKRKELCSNFIYLEELPVLLVTIIMFWLPWQLLSLSNYFPNLSQDSPAKSLREISYTLCRALSTLGLLKKKKFLLQYCMKASRGHPPALCNRKGCFLTTTAQPEPLHQRVVTVTVGQALPLKPWLCCPSSASGLWLKTKSGLSPQQGWVSCCCSPALLMALSF